jgi:HD superfamily phosphohydrolase
MNQNKLKIFNDPIYGFINMPTPLVFDIVEHPYFQRLRRISQMGLSNLVFPGANHTRFHHALGAMHLMQKAVEVLRFKGIEISDKEAEALYIAILLHDIGHGPFSHTLENAILKNIHHEEVSLMIMELLNKKFEGQLDIAIQVFTNKYERPFMYQLISSQLDMDRLDYLKRDSFYSGVAEGNINSERLIQMLNVHDNQLVIEEKGLYSVEKFLMARRLMYWQAYLHKTSLVAELMLENLLKRARFLLQKGETIDCSQALRFFMNQNVSIDTFDEKALNMFLSLDDVDIMSAVKHWQHHDDFVLSYTSNLIINRRLFKIEISHDKMDKSVLDQQKKYIKGKFDLTEEELKYFFLKGKIKNLTYNKENSPINILMKNGQIVDLILLSEQMKYSQFSKPTIKYFYAFPEIDGVISDEVEVMPK